MAEAPWKRLQDLSWKPELSPTTALKWLGYPLFFLFCFIVFAYWTFPYERLRDRLIEEAGDRGYELEIIDLGPSRLSGVTLEGVRLVLPAEGDQPPVDLIFDELTVRASLLSALSDRKSFSFSADLAGGQADGDVAFGEKELEVDAEFEEIELKRIPALRRFTKVPVFGQLGGEISLAMPEEVAESEGAVDVTVEGMRLGNGEAKVEIPGWGGLTLDEANAGDLRIEATIEEGTADIETLEADGEDLKLDVLGYVKLARPLKRSQFNLLLKAKVEESYKERSPKVATMFELAQSGRDYQAALTPDGSLQYRILGSPGARLRPQAAGKEPFRAPTKSR